MKSEIRVATKTVILLKLVQVCVRRLVLTVSSISVWTQVQWIIWLHLINKKKKKFLFGTEFLGNGARSWQDYVGAMCACIPILNGTK